MWSSARRTLSSSKSISGFHSSPGFIHPFRSRDSCSHGTAVVAPNEAQPVGNPDNRSFASHHASPAIELLQRDLAAFLHNKPLALFVA